MRKTELSVLCEMAEGLRVQSRRRRFHHAGQHEEPLDPEFPLLIRALRAHTDLVSLRIGKHERFELMMPVDARLRISMKNHDVQLAPGEILVTGKPALCAPVNARHSGSRVIVISFSPSFVFSLGSRSQDFFFLLPFHVDQDLAPAVVRDSVLLHEMHRIIVRLVKCYLDRTTHFRLGCKAFLLELLYYIARDFQSSEALRGELKAHKKRIAKLDPVLPFVDQNYARLITLKEAACVAKISVPQFVKSFKRVAGMSFVSYLTQIRLSHSLRLLRESRLTIAAIADEVGFADQSYFDRRFKAAFGQTPRDFRRQFGLS